MDARTSAEFKMKISIFLLSPVCCLHLQTFFHASTREETSHNITSFFTSSRLFYCSKTKHDHMHKFCATSLASSAFPHSRSASEPEPV
jgi:hypothetical protein